MDAPVLYLVVSWVSPEGGERYLEWLETKHLAEVIREPGFLWARKYRLDQTDKNGWAGYLLLHGLEPHAALGAYLHSPACARFFQELEPLNGVHYSERLSGMLDFQLDADRA